MMFCRFTFARSHFVTTALLIGLVGTAWAERIRFSKPAVPIAAPPKPQEDLPDLEGKSFDFVPPVDRPAVQPMPLVRVARRKDRDEEDGDSGKHWLLHNPTNFPDATGRLNSQNPLKPEKNPSPLVKAGTDPKPSEPARSLSPISDPRWGARDYEDRDESPAGGLGNRFLRSDKNDARNSHNPAPDGFGRDGSARDGSLEQDDGRGSFFSDVFAPRPKEKLTPAQLELRADFERMLNPHAPATNAPGWLNRTTGSLQPVTAMDQPLRPAGPSTTPAAGKVEGRPLDPVEAFNQQQSRLRGPVLEGMPRMPAAAPGSPAASAFDSRPQTPLLRPPLEREFPSRKF